MVYRMNKPLFYIHQNSVYKYQHEGAVELYETQQEAWDAIASGKDRRIAELKRELAELERSHDDD